MLEDTIEEYLLEQYYHWIDLFQQSVGELSAILIQLDETGQYFKDGVFKWLVEADTEAERGNDFDLMTVDMQEQRGLADKV